MRSPVRAPAVAGSWYPGTAEAVAREVDRHLAAAAAPPLPGRLVALVSPHAGLRYSGPVAACGYALLRSRAVPTVVLVGPSHRVGFDGVALQASGSWATPLGSAAIDADTAAAIVAAGGGVLFDDDSAHEEEHSLEMQLPFLQRVVPEARIVPMLMGSQSREEIDATAAALVAALAGRDAVIVASSDLSHYQPARVANRLDSAVVEHVARLDDGALLRLLESRDNVACGGGPVVAVMRAARSLGADSATILKYADSGDVEPHDKSRVVGYLSAALTASAA